MINRCNCEYQAFSFRVDLSSGTLLAHHSQCQRRLTICDVFALLSVKLEDGVTILINLGGKP